MPDSSVLSNLRERIASLQVLSCRLMHERVVVEHGLAKRRAQGIGIEPVFVRAGLCPREVRASQLSCAHTLARHTMENAISLSEREGLLDNKEASRLRDDLHRIAHAIHMTDWMKNATEVKYALLLEQTALNNTEAAASLRREEHMLAELIDRHQQSVEELRHMRIFLLNRIDAALSGE